MTRDLALSCPAAKRRYSAGSNFRMAKSPVPPNKTKSKSERTDCMKSYTENVCRLCRQGSIRYRPHGLAANEQTAIRALELCGRTYLRISCGRDGDGFSFRTRRDDRRVPLRTQVEE